MPSSWRSSTKFILSISRLPGLLFWRRACSCRRCSSAACLAFCFRDLPDLQYIIQVLNHEIRQQHKASDHYINYFPVSTKRMFKNHVHSPDALTNRMMVYTAHTHPLPRHHIRGHAFFSLLSITIGKKGDWGVNIPACSAVCPKASCKQKINPHLRSRG